MSDSNSVLAAELQETRAKLAASEAKVKEFEAAVQQKPLLRKWIEASKELDRLRREEIRTANRSVEEREAKPETIRAKRASRVQARRRAEGASRIMQCKRVEWGECWGCDYWKQDPNECISFRYAKAGKSGGGE